MWSFLEQAGAARSTACEIRRHLWDVHPEDIASAARIAERLDARAAELEYRWLTLPPPQTRSRPGRSWFTYSRR
jgi:hypothetical protein